MQLNPTEMKSGETVLLAFGFFFFQPSLETTAVAAHPAMKGANVLFLQTGWRWIHHPFRQAKISLGAAHGLPRSLLLQYSLGHRVPVLGATFRFCRELGLIWFHPLSWAAGIGLCPVLQMKHCMGSSGPYCTWCRTGLAQLLPSSCSFLSRNSPLICQLWRAHFK